MKQLAIFPVAALGIFGGGLGLVQLTLHFPIHTVLGLVLLVVSLVRHHGITGLLTIALFGATGLQLLVSGLFGWEPSSHWVVVSVYSLIQVGFYTYHMLNGEHFKGAATLTAACHALLIGVCINLAPQYVQLGAYAWTASFLCGSIAFVCSWFEQPKTIY